MSFCAPCLYCCVSNAQKVDIVMSQLGAVNTINRLEEGESPQLVCGRVLPVKEDFFIAPAINKACVYYQTVIEELVDKTEGNMLEGQADNNDRVWVSKCIETRAADFCIVDPAFPDLKVYVPGGHFKLKARALEDDLNGKADGTGLVLSEFTLTPQIQDLFTRNKFVVGNRHLNRIRIREASFEYAEQVVALGIVKDVTDPTTEKVNKVMFPLDSSALTDSYFESRHITGWTKQSLMDVCHEPCIIVSSDENHFRGVQVGKLKRKMVCADYVDIQHVLSTGVNNIDRQLD